MVQEIRAGGIRIREGTWARVNSSQQWPKKLLKLEGLVEGSHTAAMSLLHPASRQ